MPKAKALKKRVSNMTDTERRVNAHTVLQAAMEKSNRKGKGMTKKIPIIPGKYH